MGCFLLVIGGIHDTKLGLMGTVQFPVDKNPANKTSIPTAWMALSSEGARTDGTWSVSSPSIPRDGPFVSELRYIGRQQYGATAAPMLWVTRGLQSPVLSAQHS